MKIIFVVIVIQIACLFVSAEGQSIDGGFYGIKLFETDKADLDKALGKAIPFGDTTIYDTKPSTFVWFSRGPCSSTTKLWGQYKADLDIVVAYRIVFKDNRLLSAMKWTAADFTRKPLNDDSSFVTYESKDGSTTFDTVIGVGKEYIVDVTYLPTPAQKKKYACPDPARHS